MQFTQTPRRGSNAEDVRNMLKQDIRQEYTLKRETQRHKTESSDKYLKSIGMPPPRKPSEAVRQQRSKMKQPIMMDEPDRHYTKDIIYAYNMNFKNEDDKRRMLEKKTEDPSHQPPQMKKGGEIKKTGLYQLHKGEIVIPANRVKSVEAALKKDKKKPLKK
jgi:outer membrane translocation and assembly module TamA